MDKRTSTLLKKELREQLHSLKFLASLVLLVFASLVSGFGGVNMIRSLENWLGREIHLFLGLSNSLGLSFREIALIYSPLFVILISVDAISREFESRNIIRLFSTPITRRQFLMVKMSSTFLFAIIIGLVSTIIPTYIIYSNVKRVLTLDDLARVLLYLYVYVIYLCIWGTISLVLSGFFKRTTYSLSIAIISFIIITFLWLPFSIFISGLYNIEPIERIKIERSIRMFSIKEIFDKTFNFLLNPHYIGISNGEWLFDWNKTINFSESFSLVFGEILLLTASLFLLVLVYFRMAENIQVKPRI